MREALGCIDQRILRRARFDPLTDDREFTIALSDMAEAIFMPRALNAVSRAAPEVRLRSVALPQAELQQALSEGRLDLALGYMPDLVASEFVRRKIDQHSFVCICSAANRKVIQGFNLDKYLEARHVLVQAPGRTQGLFERYLQERGIERRVALTTPHFMSLPEIVAGTDMLASIPGALAGFFVGMKRLVRLELPFRSPVFENHLHWSKSVHSDPANRWLRDTLFRAFAGKA
jgi:DNA-binding transcriptional LysR family regulator